MRRAAAHHRAQGGHLLLPSIAVASNGRFAAIAATASDASLVFPSSAYLPLTIASSGRTSVGSVVMLARGAGPYDAESGYKDSWSHSGDSSSDDKVANWGE